MKRSFRGRKVRVGYGRFIALLSVVLSPWTVRADQVRMQNGDSYYGDVVSLDRETLVLESDILGTVRVPRIRVAGVAFGVKAKSAVAPPLNRTNQLFRNKPITGTNGPSDLSAAFRQLGSESNLVQQIQTQFLGDAGPEAKDKFNQLLGGLMSGKMNLTDLRTEARSAADQVRAVRKDLGDETGALVDGYLAILDSFLKETEPTGSVVTNIPSVPAKPKPAAEEEQ